MPEETWRTPQRRRLPNERQAITHRFEIGGHKGYITVGLYEDGTPGEIFLLMAKEGSTIAGMCDAFALAVSYALQYGVPLQALVNRFSHMRFEPSGFTKNPEIPIAKSIVDYVFRWLRMKFPLPQVGQHDAPQEDAPPCSECGAVMVRSGSLWRCGNCGHTEGE